MLSGRHLLMTMLCIAAYSVAGCGKSHTETDHVQSNPKTRTDKVVNLYIWADYLAPTTLSSFEERTGIKVNVSYFDSYETLEARMLTGHSGFDVVLPASGTFTREIQSGSYLLLDKRRLPNAVNLDPTVVSMAARTDPGNAHGVVFTSSTYGLGFNKKLIVERLPNVPLTTWRIVFDPALAAKLAPCGINFIDDPVGVVQLVLKYLGRDPARPSPQDFSDAESVLVKVRPFIRNIDTSGEIEAMANGDLCISLGYNGDFVQAIRRAAEAKNGIELSYVIPEEGSLEGFDFLAIPQDATNLDNAYLLINYLLEPRVMANICNATAFANVNLAAVPLLAPAVASNSIIFPTRAEQQRLFAQTEVSSEQSRVITRIWQRFKTGQ